MVAGFVSAISREGRVASIVY
ncbi:hypothetical protein MED222_05085 [Vibrio sp. MED222]|nr:hypothetical protein MED222_05085 [Vibrio sp. MED222]